MAGTDGSNGKGYSGITDAQLTSSVIQRQLATPEELAMCRAKQERLARQDQHRPLIQILVDERVLTVNQAKRLLRETGPQNTLKQIPGYQLIEKAGQGSMGVVYKGRQLSLDRLVAIKVLLQQLSMNKDFIERFHREAKLAAKLAHNNIVQAIDSGEVDGYHYFVMEYVDGKTVKDYLDKGQVYDEKEAINIIYQIADALNHASQKGLIHRDIKPENIIRASNGVMKLADMGLARLTRDEEWAQKEAGMAIGTPYYISPEQIRGELDVDIRTDIYSLGATLYHMVTGRPPFPGDSPTEVMQKHLRSELTPPDHIRPELSNGVAEVVELLMAKDRRQRYQKPEDLIIDLECLLNDEPPRLARQLIEASTLASLAEGEEEEDEEADADKGPGWPMVYALIGALALSLALNLLLFLTR